MQTAAANAARRTASALGFRARSFSRVGDGGACLPLSVGVWGVWGANTGVGKTLVCAALASSEAGGTSPLLYVKPLQTGWPSDSDGERVALAAAAGGATARHSLGEHAGWLTGERGEAESGSARVLARTLFAWQQAVGPHAAVQREGRGVDDDVVAAAVAAELQRFAESCRSAKGPVPLALVEAAGGVCSPGPSGALQCDILRPLRLPALLVGDGRLGRVSCLFASCAAHAARAGASPPRSAHWTRWRAGATTWTRWWWWRRASGCETRMPSAATCPAARRCSSCRPRRATATARRGRRRSEPGPAAAARHWLRCCGVPTRAAWPSWPPRRTAPCARSGGPSRSTRGCAPPT
jgi:dethiobiotin synthetase